VGLKWNLASVKVTEEISGTVHSIDVVNEGTHVLYMIERQQLGKNKDPNPINNDAFEKSTTKNRFSFHDCQKWRMEQE